MASNTRQQPAWQTPSAPSPEAALPPLKIWNSLTRSKTQFIPIDWKTRTVSWYACGPTVYDDAHLGHARNYVSTDIIRRILRDYFKYNVKFVMNITDVDDKIIVRGRQQHILADFVSKHPSFDKETQETSLEALKAYLTKNLSRIPSEGTPADLAGLIKASYGSILEGGSLDDGPPGDKEAKLKMHIKTALSAADGLLLAQGNEISSQEFFSAAQDVLLPYLDSLYGSAIDAEDHTVFTKLTRKFEARFTEDVRALNCLDPDVITRVTEYGAQIVEFVEKIQQNGFAYKTSDGSVYFDIAAFEGANNSYARLEPWNRNDTDLQADGEGALTKKTAEKKSDADFALWKSSKPGEPSWPSPWGKGRPGWHIECSAMASDILGSQIDIHSGGIDLAFPHHDNELAQSEAYWLDQTHNHQHQWVNYFMHMGHLSIQGSKMSKSLKNFTTIRDALDRGDWTPRGLRIVFLLGGWKEGIEITDDIVKAGSAWEDKVNNFFIKANDYLSNNQEDSDSPSNAASTFDHSVTKAVNQTFEALCDSFNTPLAMAAISELISAYNTTDRSEITTDDTKKAAKWVTLMVNTFGLNGNTSPNDPIIGWSGISIPEIAKNFIYPLSTFRDELRRKARAQGGLSPENVKVPELQASSSAGQKEAENPYAKIAANFASNIKSLESSTSYSKDVLSLCDRLRDVDLWNQDIYLEDRDDNRPALVRPVTKELRAARQDKEERERQKQRAKDEREKEAAAKADKGRQSHLEMFRTSEYREWDSEGIPTVDAEGKEINKSRAKKLRKEWERQKRLHEAWRKSVE